MADSPVGSAPPAPGKQSASTRPPLVLEEMIAELTWPRLWQAGRLALRPARVGLAVFYLLGLMLVVSAVSWVNSSSRTEAPSSASEAAMSAAAQSTAPETLSDQARFARVGLAMAVRSARLGDVAGAATGMVSAFVTAPARALRIAPISTVLGGIAILLWTAVIGGAICRTAATELAWSRTVPWPSALALGLSRWKSLAGALALPLVIIWLIALALSVAGWALFSVGLLSILGGLGWLLFLAAGVVAAFFMLGLMLGAWMLVPAVVTEGADAIDSVQHTVAMVFGRPLRLVLYILTLLVQGLLLALLVGLIAATAVLFARASAAAWLDPSHAAILDGATLFRGGEVLSAAPGTWRAGAGLVNVSTVVFGLIAVGILVSYAWCAATALFLAMRRVCDGQDFSELWSPGMVESTTSRPPEFAPSAASPPVRARESIIDNGPADEG